MINGHVQNHGISQYHEFPRFCRVDRRKGPDPELIMTQNVFPDISVQSILYQLPYGAKNDFGPMLSILFWKIILAR